MSFVTRPVLKWVFFLASFCLGGAQSWAASQPSVSIVSDIDDTVKLTHVNDPIDALRRTFGERRAFAGMSELYRAEISDEGELDFVSGAPAELRPLVELFLGQEGFPTHQLRIRDALGQPEIFQFKVREISRILDANPSRSYILIGDDTERDPLTLRTVAGSHRSQVAAFYIHKVRGLTGMPGEKPFYTALDIALQERAAGRLDSTGIQDVITRLENASIEDEVIPEFAACPPMAWLDRLNSSLGLQLDPSTTAAIHRFELRVQESCISRD